MILQLNVLQLGVTFTQRAYDMTAKVTLHNLTIEDCIQQFGEGFKYLATSKLVDTDDDTNDMITVSFTQINKVNVNTSTCH